MVSAQGGVFCAALSVLTASKKAGLKTTSSKRSATIGLFM
jgi:hypothetical protein